MERFFFNLKTALTYQIFNSTSELPIDWDDWSVENIFLSTSYLEVLDASAPENMICHYIGFYRESTLVGVALSQFLDANHLATFGDRDRCIKTSVRNFIFKNFSSHVLFIGNNMLTGQNAFYFSPEIDPSDGFMVLTEAAEELKNRLQKKGKKVHLTSFKDFTVDDLNLYAKGALKGHYTFSIQPNMILDIRESWQSIDDYVSDLSKKYRDQYKRSRKKAEQIEKRKMGLEEIIKYEAVIYELYFHVATNAPFNTFFLAKNHFRVFKEKLKDKFLFYGYFIGDNLIGFNTLIKNGDAMDTYFLGYDEEIQREKMLYLNMLYDMIAYSIHKGFKEIIFARTALEIKSSIGARPEPMFGFIKHSNPLAQWQMPKIFNALQPEIQWQERHPFKEV